MSFDQNHWIVLILSLILIYTGASKFESYLKNKEKVQLAEFASKERINMREMELHRWELYKQILMNR